MEPNTATLLAIENCYAAFSSYPCPTALSASPYRESKEILLTLTSAPLRDLTVEDIGYYAGCAITTVGFVDDYRYFLPRILEQSARDNVRNGTEPAIIAGKLKLGNWRRWPVPEQEAVRQLFISAFGQAIEEPVETDFAQAWLCGIGVLGSAEMESALCVLTKAHSANVAHHVAELVFLTRQTRWMRRGFWVEVEASTVAVVENWLLGDAPKQILLAALDRADPSDVPRFETALDCLISDPLP